MAFLQKQAKSLDLLFRIYYVHRNKPIVVLTWIGTDSSESAILLNSHMDVVPVVEVSHNIVNFELIERKKGLHK